MRPDPAPGTGTPLGVSNPLWGQGGPSQGEGRREWVRLRLPSKQATFNYFIFNH